jgi:hypothetical protein
MQERKMKKLVIIKPDGTELVYIEGEVYSFGDLLNRASEAFDCDWHYVWK